MSFAIVDATYRMADDGADGISRSRYTMPIGNVPLISHVIEDLVAGGVSRARIVAGADERRGLERALDDTDATALAIDVVEAPPTSPERGVLAELDAALGAEPVVLAPGDGLYPGLLGEMCARYESGDVDLVVSATDTPGPGGDSSPTRLSGTALVLGPRARALVTELLEPVGACADLSSALRGADLRVAVCDASAGWTYEGSTEALLAGNRQVLDRLPDEPLAEALGERVDSRLHGRIRLGRGVVASGCVIHGPVAIADHVVLEDCHVGPFTAIGQGAVLRGAEIDDSIVLGGAEIRHPGHRITASIIGERARVQRTFELPRGVHLRLGPGSELSFS